MDGLGRHNSTSAWSSWVNCRIRILRAPHLFNRMFTPRDRLLVTHPGHSDHSISLRIFCKKCAFPTVKPSLILSICSGGKWEIARSPGFVTDTIEVPHPKFLFSSQIPGISEPQSGTMPLRLPMAALATQSVVPSCAWAALICL